MFKRKEALNYICPICQTKKEVFYGSQKETLTVRKEKIDVDAKVFYCPEGDHFFSNLDDDEEKFQKVYREYRKRNKILQPEEVKQIRENYKLTQGEFSFFLGYGEKTINRYETGAIPDDGHNNLIKLMQDTDSFRKHFDNVKHKIPPKMAQKIIKSLGELAETEKQLTSPRMDTISEEQKLSGQLIASTGSTGVSNEEFSKSLRKPLVKTKIDEKAEEMDKERQKELAVAA